MDEDAIRDLRLACVYGLRLGARVRIHGIRPELLLALMILADFCRGSEIKPLVTSMIDGAHMNNSLHYVGAAFDFVSDLTEDRDAWLNELRMRLGRDFDVVDEHDHVHIEYQPHVGAVT